MVVKLEGAGALAAERWADTRPELDLCGGVPMAAEGTGLCVINDAGDLAGIAAFTVDAAELTLRRWVAEPEAEWALMDAVVEAASARRCTRVRAEFTANGHNRGMSDYPARFGFTLLGGDEASALWMLPVSAYEPMG